ncbi:adenylate/guanylate cyclase domain-containing protein [Devosia rhodophyticola]|uniref:Adenylate/guanylate cyclase domain-containing protein n=1 Tax=Devosia rhodophyticola TaxID=3026423 RepID=A0ABY7YXM7_9HYPH|nr:adenylate/guanylate cyclase domain-containing protein [Devosia rhodophyticola]WDR06071.1 adenylate/guanylate cyclase domain-containing protein [Devosia rhodophyticola]
MGNWRSTAVFLGIVLVGLLTILRASDPYTLRVAREATFDLFQQIQPRPAIDLPVRIIDIDEASMVALGQWPWPRTVLATLTQRLTKLGAAAIAFDILFAEPDRPGAQGQGGDTEFAEALGQSPAILGMSDNLGSPNLPDQPKSGIALTGDAPLAALPSLTGATMPLPALLEPAAGLGVVSLEQAAGGGVVRRLPLLWQSGGKVYPALSVEALRIAMGVSTLVVLGDTSGAAAVDGLRIGDLTVPTSADGGLWLYYRRLDPAMSISAATILGDNFSALAPDIAGHIVLIGASATGLGDVRAGALGQDVSGVSIHAQAIEQMLTGTFLNRADWVGGLEMALFALTGIVITVLTVFSGPFVGLVFSLIATAMAVTACWLAFTQWGLLVDPSFTFLGALTVYAAMAFFQFASTDADRRRIRNAFGHYVAPTLLTRIEKNPAELRLGGEIRELTVLFSDVRNFTGISERLPPAALVRLLNTIFGAMGAEITGQLGTIDKFMGDAVMAFWNAPIAVNDHPRHACRAALGMRLALATLNRQNDPGLGGEPVAVGIGIATGPALIGNMGLESRFDYSCIGETVNLSSRIEGACRAVGYDILVTKAVRDLTADLAYLPAGSLALKGISVREPVYILVGDEALALSPAFQSLADDHHKLVSDLSDTEATKIALDRCRQAVQSVEIGLHSFYARIHERADDFCASPQGAKSSANADH